MSCEQKDLAKEWNKRVVDLVNQKDKFLKDPEAFLATVWTMADYDQVALPSISEMEIACLKAVLRFTGGMRPEELTALKEGLEKTWKEKKANGEDRLEFEFRCTVNSLMVCQDVRRVSCVKMVPDL